MSTQVKGKTEQSLQLTTFYVEKDLYGIEVMRVQEVTGNPSVVAVPLTPKFVSGLINLRGQIATALGLRTLFGHSETTDGERMSVVCKIENNLVSLIVDSIGDVVEVDANQFEVPPQTIPQGVRKFLKGICKMDGVLLSVIDLEKLAIELSNSVEGSDGANKLKLGDAHERRSH